jgi:hypothetical protein
MTCPICNHRLSPEEAENNICVRCEHNMDEVREQQEIDTEEAKYYKCYEIEPLSGLSYSI